MKILTILQMCQQNLVQVRLIVDEVEHVPLHQQGSYYQRIMLLYPEVKSLETYFKKLKITIRTCIL